MGYDVKRFQGTVDEELICSICKDVFQNPIQINKCQHAFCATCIKTWFARELRCPIDRQNVEELKCLSVAHRVLRILLSRLQIHCDFAEHGCDSVVRLELLPAHLKTCTFDPKKPVKCEKGCEALIPKGEIATHHCVRDLRIKFDLLEARVKLMEEEKTKNENCNRPPVPPQFSNFTIPADPNTPGVPGVPSTSSAPSTNYFPLPRFTEN